MSIKATFPAGVQALTVNGLHQWDYGQALEIEAPDLPALVEVHFACAGMLEAVVRSCALADGKVTAAIPDICLEQTTPVVAWVYEVGETSGRTTRTVTLPIIQRAKPQGSVTISPAMSDKYTELAAAVNALVEGIKSGEIKVAVDHVENADHAATADNAAEAAHAAEADHAATADNAAEAAHAAEADAAGTLTEVLPPEKGGTGVKSLSELAAALGGGGGGSSDYAAEAGHATNADYAAEAGHATNANNAAYAVEAGNVSTFGGYSYGQLFAKDFSGNPIANGAMGLAGYSDGNVVYVDASQVIALQSRVADLEMRLASLGG